MGTLPPGLLKYQQQRQQMMQSQSTQQLDPQGFPFASCMTKMQGAGYSQGQALAMCNNLKQKFLAQKQQQSPLVQQQQQPIGT